MKLPMRLPANLLRLLPFLRWPRPSAQSLQRDAWAGISVGLVLIPQALAYASLAGMPPQTGLYAAMLPCVVGMLWGSSALLAVGPVALTSILVFGSLSSLATPGSAQWIALAIWLALYSGLIQFVLGAAQMGKITYLVSQPVITGFMNAAAMLIIFSQLPHLFGIEFSSGVTFASVFDGSSPLLLLSPASVMTAAFGCTALAALLLLKRFVPKWPGLLIVTVLGIVASHVLGFAAAGGATVGHLSAGLPPLSMPPALPFDSHVSLLPLALILAVISFTEAMSSCRVLARKTNAPWDENQELIGQGLAKIASGFSGAFPVSGSFSRSALNLYAGATSAWASLVAALCVLLCLLFFIDLIQDLPYAILAAMIIMPVFNLLDLAAFGRLFRISRDDALVALVTFFVTLGFTSRLHYGVFAGIAVTMVCFLYRRTHPRIIEVARHADGTLRDRLRFDLPPLAPGVLAVRMDSALNFLTAATLERFITEKCRADGSIRCVLLGASGINDIDATGIDVLTALLQSLRADGIELYLAAVKKQVAEVLDHAGLSNAIGADHFFATDSVAIAALSTAAK